MSFTFGVFDVFTHAATGSLYAACVAYLLVRLGWVDPARLAAANTTVLLLGILLVSYLLGQLVYWLGKTIDDVLPGHRDPGLQPRSRFDQKIPTGCVQRTGGLAKLDPHLLLAALEIHAREAAHEVSRLRAAGLGLRNATPALLVATAIAVVEIFLGGRPAVAGVLAMLLALASVAALQRGRVLREWAVMKTFELAYWVPEVTQEIRDHRRSGP